VLEEFCCEELAQFSLDDLATYLQDKGHGRFSDPAELAATLQRAARDSYRLEKVLQGGFANRRPQRRLRDLRDREQVILDVDDRFHRVDDAIENHRVDGHRHFVAGDALLRRDRHGPDLHVDLHQPIDERNDHREAGLADPTAAARDRP